MKTTKIKISVLLMAIIALVFHSCKKDSVLPDAEESILPESFSVDIPNSMSYEYSSNKKGKTNVDAISGDEIYAHLANFVHLGENAAYTVETIIYTIKMHGLSQAMSFSYVSDEDARTKNVNVIENSDFEGTTYEYQLTITDALSESEADSGKALQIFWNKSPVKGVAMLKPYNMNRTANSGLTDAMFRIDYSEAGEYGYEKHMVVSISGIPLEDPLVNPYSVQSVKMFAGKTGDVVDLYGNSNHPNAKFFTTQTGFNWAFVASGNTKQDIAVAEVGLPESTLDETDRQVLLVNNSIKSVLSAQIYDIWPTIDSTSVEELLANCGAPGYFSDGGFVQGETSPGAQYSDLEGNILQLTPYNPINITNLELTFK